MNYIKKFKNSHIDFWARYTCSHRSNIKQLTLPLQIHWALETRKRLPNIDIKENKFFLGFHILCFEVEIIFCWKLKKEERVS